MGIKTYNPYTPSRRQMTGSDFSEITKTTPEKSLLESKKRKAREIKMVLQQRLSVSSTIRTEVLTSH